jgi:ABC transporter substrate binding protein
VRWTDGHENISQAKIRERGRAPTSVMIVMCFPCPVLGHAYAICDSSALKGGGQIFCRTNCPSFRARQRRQACAACVNLAACGASELKRVAPGISRVGMMYNPDNPSGAAYFRSLEMFAGQLPVQPINLPIHDMAEIERAIASLTDQPNSGALVPPDFTNSSLRTQVSALLVRHRVPAISTDPGIAAAGGLVSYGPDRLVMFRKSASYVDRILRGEKPGDLPFQQPTIYRFVINLKTAKSLGLTVPDTLLVAADELIE